MNRFIWCLLLSGFVSLLMTIAVQLAIEAAEQRGRHCEGCGRENQCPHCRAADFPPTLMIRPLPDPETVVPYDRAGAEGWL